MNRILLITLLSFPLFSSGQTAWIWTELDSMILEISNNAVAVGTQGGAQYVYSFGGIDSTKIWSGITKRAFKYDVAGDSWSEIAPLPAALDNIAAAAHNVNNKIYIIGGYNVSSGGGEISSNEVIIYNPETDLYETNGAAIPVPIDDQVQAVWNDSLIYVITGWSNTTNVPNVQIYDPALDSWSVGTPVPNTVDYKVFGGSGYIIGDTIFYFGGAKYSGSFFPATTVLRMGIIDPADPTQISWSMIDDGPNTGYRQACISHGKNIYWVGGSSISYNYNGIAYNGSGGVEPLTQIMRFDTDSEIWYPGDGAPYSVMDLRGAAQIGPTSWIICGGMKEGQEVSRRTFRLDFDPIIGGVSESEKGIKIIGRQIISDLPLDHIELYSVNGKKVVEISPDDLFIPQTVSGFYILQCSSGDRTFSEKITL